MVNPQYKTITYDATAAELNLNTWYSNGPTDVNASKIILSNNLTWDIKWQMIVKAKQEMILDGDGYTITLAKDTAGAGTSPSNFRGLICMLMGNVYSDSRADSDDYYGIYVKNLIIDSIVNSIGLDFSTTMGCGYLFGTYYSSNQAYGPDGRPSINARVTTTTKNTFICNKVQIKGYYTDNSNKTWIQWKTGRYGVTDNSYKPYYRGGAFIGETSGRGKFINCIANARFCAKQLYGYWEFINCFVNTKSLISGYVMNRQSNPNHHKYIFQNCIAWKLFDNFYNTSTHSDITNSGKILEISDCKVDYSEYWTYGNDGWGSITLPENSNDVSIVNSSKGFDYLDDVSGEIKTAKNAEILAVINGDSAFVINNNTITLQFSPYVGVDIADVLAIRAIDLTSTDVVAESSIPATWFNNLAGSGETLERNKETRRNNLITEVFTANSTKTFFDISKSVINLPTNSIKESTRIFKVDSTSKTATVNLNTNTALGDKKGFYVPLTTNNQKVDITSKDGNITFQLERTGLGSDGKATYTITKTAGTSNLIIDS